MSGCWAPQLRDPALGRAGQQLRPPERAGTGCAAGSPPRTGTTPHHRAVLVRRGLVFLLTVLGHRGVDLYARGCGAIMLDFVLAPLCSASLLIVVDRIVRAFKPLPALFCSIYDRDCGGMNGTGRCPRS